MGNMNGVEKSILNNTGFAGMASSVRVVGVMLLAIAAQADAVAQTQTPVAGIYTCVDARGRKLTSDRPIPECNDREQKVLNPSGTVKSKLGPTLTAQERSEVEAKEKLVLEDQARPTPRGPVVRVRVVESGEELDYRIESLIADPQER